MPLPIGFDNISTEQITIAPGSHGVAAVCGLLDGESLHLEYGLSDGCNDVCWVEVKECGEKIVLDNDNNPMPFGQKYQGLFRWVADLPLNENVNVYTMEVTAGAKQCQK